MTLYFGFGSLLNGTTYPASITLTAPSKHLQVAFSLEKLSGGAVVPLGENPAYGVGLGERRNIVCSTRVVSL